MTVQQQFPVTLAPSAPPLAATLERVSALSPYLGAQLLGGLEPGWVLASDLLAAPPSTWLAPLLDEIMAQHHAPDRKTAATFLMGWYAWYVIAPVIASYLTERRVPSLAFDQLALRFAVAEDGPRVKVGLLDASFAALPDDRAAAAQPIADVEALRELLRTRIEAHMSLVIEAVSAHTRLGRRGLWNMIADTCAELFLWTGQLSGRAEAWMEGRALINAPGSPLSASPTEYLHLPIDEPQRTFRLRGSCCRYYKVPGGTNCDTCPLLSREECEQRLLAALPSDQ